MENIYLKLFKKIFNKNEILKKLKSLEIVINSDDLKSSEKLVNQIF